ncbi:MAG TPA: hypothetical protein VL527_08930 [Dongiaceae bacterium]|jgi:hypothetical protein|nr:hypothetical protein [Dongiaceae bacterium]
MIEIQPQANYGCHTFDLPSVPRKANHLTELKRGIAATRPKSVSKISKIGDNGLILVRDSAEAGEKTSDVPKKLQFLSFEKITCKSFG